MSLAGWAFSDGTGRTPALESGHPCCRATWYCFPVSTVPAPARRLRGWLRLSGRSASSTGFSSGLFWKQVLSGGRQRAIGGSAPYLLGSDLLILLLPGPWPAGRAIRHRPRVRLYSRTCPARSGRQPQAPPISKSLPPRRFSRPPQLAGSSHHPPSAGTCLLSYPLVNRAQAFRLRQPNVKLPCGHTCELRERGTGGRHRPVLLVMNLSCAASILG